MSAARSKQKKKKWAKGSVKDKKENVVVYDQGLYNKVAKEIARMKVITIAALSERYQISGSLARRTIQVFEEEGLIKRISRHSSFLLYTANNSPAEADAEAAE